MAEGLKIIIGADATPAEQALKKFGSELSKLENQVAAFGGGVKAFGNQFSAGITAPIPSVKKLGSELSKLKRPTDQASGALINLGRVAQDAPFGILGIANNLNPLLEGFQRLRASAGSNKEALKQLGQSLIGGGGLGLALSVASSLLIVFGDRLFGASKAAEEAEDATKKYKDQVKGIFAEAGKEATQVVSLIAVLKSETETRERKLAAIKELQRIQPEVFKGLKLEGTAVTGLDAAYTAYLANLRTVIAVKIKQAQLDTLIAKQLEQQGATLTASEKKLKGFSDALRTAQTAPGVGKEVGLFGKTLTKGLKDAQTEAQKTQTDIEALIKDIGELSTGVEIKIDTPKKDTDEAFNKIISKAKEVSAFLKDSLFVINYEFSPLDDKATALKKAQDFLNQVAAGGLEIKTLPAQVPIELSEPPPAKIEQALSETDKLLKRSILQLPPTEIPVEFSATEEQNAAIISDFRKKFEALGVGLQLQEGDLADPSLFNKLSGQFKQVAGAIEVANLAAATLANTFQSVFSRIIEGENPIKAFFQSIGQAILQLITQLIAAAIKAAIFKAILSGATGGGGGFLKFLAGGLTGFAQGGIVSGPTLALVGEGVGTSRSNPEVIAPLDQLKSMLGSFGGGGQQVVIINGRTRGNQFELLANRTNRQNRRLGAG